MKYFSENSNDKSLMGLPLSFTIIFILIFWMINFLLFTEKMGFSPESVANYYLGNEENFQPARSAVSMLEVSHGHLAMFAVLLLVVTHLVIFSNYRKNLKIFVIIGAYGGAFFSEASSWLIRFVDPRFSYLKLGGFIMLQLFIFISLIGVIQYIRKMRRQNKGRL